MGHTAVSASDGANENYCNFASFALYRLILISQVELHLIEWLAPSIIKTCPCNIQIFSPIKIEHFHGNIFDIFLIFAQNIDCGYTLEPPRRSGSNEYPQSMFWSKNKKNRYNPAYPSFAI